MFSPRQQFSLFLALSTLLNPSACNSGKQQHVMGTTQSGIHKQPSGPSVEVVTASPGPGSVQRYTQPGSCSMSSLITTNTITYSVDQCQNLNPHNIAQIQIVSPAICPNGTRALFKVFGSSNCWGSVSETTPVSDDVVGRCIDASHVWSCAFICEGLPDGAPWGKVAAVVAVIGGLAVVGVTVLTGLFFCGGGLIVVGLMGLCLWGFWILVGLIRRGFGSAAVSEKPDAKDKPEENEAEQMKKFK